MNLVSVVDREMVGGESASGPHPFQDSGLEYMAMVATVWLMPLIRPMPSKQVYYERSERLAAWTPVRLNAAHG